jgi:hypothetical protein
MLIENIEENCVQTIHIILVVDVKICRLGDQTREGSLTHDLQIWPLCREERRFLNSRRRLNMFCRQECLRYRADLRGIHGFERQWVSL